MIFQDPRSPTQFTLICFAAIDKRSLLKEVEKSPLQECEALEEVYHLYFPFIFLACLDHY